MARISQLPLVSVPDGTESFVVLKDGQAARVAGTALLTAAGDVSLEALRQAAELAKTRADAAEQAAANAAAAATAAQAAATQAAQVAQAAAQAVAAIVIPPPSPYVIGFSFIAPLDAGEVFGFHVAGAAFSLPANFANAFVGAVGTLPSAAQVLTLRVAGAIVGTFTIATSGAITAATSAAAPVNVARGALVTLEGPPSADATAARIGLTLIGTRA